MNFVLTGVSHNDAPLHILERVAVSENELPSRIEELSARLNPDDSATILSTCNRTEIYAITNDAGATMEEMVTYLSLLGTRNRPTASPVVRSEISPFVYTKTGYDAVHHLFRVVTGLDSLVQGDHQVAGQVSRSFQALSEVSKPAEPALSRMFHVAFRTGRQARKESGIGWSQVSVPSFGVKLLESEIGDLAGKSVLLVGAGETGRLTAMSLMRERASQTCLSQVGHALDPKGWPETWVRSPFISRMCHKRLQTSISSSLAPAPARTSSSSPTSRLESAPVRLIFTSWTSAFPVTSTLTSRNCPEFLLYTLSDLERLQAEHQKSIATASEKAEIIVAEAAAEFIDDIELQPLLRDLGESAERIRASELQRTLAKIETVDDATREALDAMTRSMVKRILADPIEMIKRRKR